MSAENWSVGPLWLWVSYSIFLSPISHWDTILSSFQDPHRCWWGWTREQNFRKPCLLTCPPVIWDDAGREYSGNVWGRHTQETLIVCRNLSYRARIYESCIRTVIIWPRPLFFDSPFLFSSASWFEPMLLFHQMHFSLPWLNLKINSAFT